MAYPVLRGLHGNPHQRRVDQSLSESRAYHAAQRDLDDADALRAYTAPEHARSRACLDGPADEWEQQQ